MALLVPLISFLIGFFGVRVLRAWRTIFASVLARVLIPAVIVYNMVFYREGSLWLIGFSFFSSVLLFAVFYFCLKDKLRALCLSYLNGAWLGFPFALALFGPEASNTMVALYIGGSLFGNICAVMAVSQTRQSSVFILKNVLLSPPVLALSLAAILSRWDLSAFESNLYLQRLYQLNKLLLTFMGMCVLGMWLSQVRIHWADVWRSFKLIGLRMFAAMGFCAVAYLILPIPQQMLTYAVMLMFFALPPAANIVALETYYQGTGHSAQYIASGTLASSILIAVYALIVHWYLPL